MESKVKVKRPVYFWIGFSTDGRSSTVYICSGPDAKDIGKENMAEKTTSSQASYLEKCCKELNLRVSTFGGNDSHEVNFKSIDDAWSLSDLLVKHGWVRLMTSSFGDGSEPYCFNYY